MYESETGMKWHQSPNSSPYVKYTGPDDIKRFNMFQAISVNGSPADGYSSGQAIKAIEESGRRNVTLPGYGCEFSGRTREEQSSSGNTTAFIFSYFVSCSCTCC